MRAESGDSLGPLPSANANRVIVLGVEQVFGAAIAMCFERAGHLVTRDQNAEDAPAHESAYAVVLVPPVLVYDDGERRSYRADVDAFDGREANRRGGSRSGHATRGRVAQPVPRARAARSPSCGPLAHCLREPATAGASEPCQSSARNRPTPRVAARNIPGAGRWRRPVLTDRASVSWHCCRANPSLASPCLSASRRESPARLLRRVEPRLRCVPC